MPLVHTTATHSALPGKPARVSRGRKRNARPVLIEMSETPRVALLIESSRAYGRNLLLGIAQYVREHGPWTIEFEEGDLSGKVPAWFNRWRGHGVIAQVRTQTLAGAITKLGVPVVDLNCCLPGLKMHTIRSNESTVGQMAAQHLLERGFRRFAFCGFNGTDWSDRRREGFLQHLAKAGFGCEVFSNPHLPLRASDLEYEEHGLVHERELARWIMQLAKPIGLMACNDARGRQVLGACRAMGVAVPDQMAVIGVDRDEVLCDLSPLPLSSIILNTKCIGYEAARLLDTLMAGKEASSSTILIEPLGVSTRRSTDVLSVEDPNLAKALLFIRDHACEGFTIDKVAAFAGLSRRVLQRKFRQLFNETVHDAMVKARVRRACDLLSTTQLPMIDIAEKAGFKYVEYMGVVFKAQLGQTPAEFRKKSRQFS